MQNKKDKLKNAITISILIGTIMLYEKVGLIGLIGISLLLWANNISERIYHDTD